MPIYEYECLSCRRRVSLLVLNPSSAAPPRCPRCGGGSLRRLVSRVAPVQSQKEAACGARAAGRSVKAGGFRRGRPQERGAVHEEDGERAGGGSRRGLRLGRGRGHGGSHDRGVRRGERRGRGVKVESLDRFDLLDEGTWNGLLARTAAPVLFLTWQWQEHWWRAFGAGGRLRGFPGSGFSGRLMGA